MSGFTTSDNYRAIVDSLIEDSNFIKATSIYDKAYKKHPEDIMLLFDIALYYDTYIDSRKALEFYDKILDLDQFQAGAYYGKAIIYDELEEDSRAMSNYEKAIEVDPDYFEAYINLAALYEYHKKYEEAEKCYLNAIEIGDDLVTSYVNYASLLDLLGRDAEALDYCHKALEIDDDDYMAYFNIAVIYKKQDQIENAIELYEKVILLKQDYAYSFLNLAVIYKEQSNYEKARDIITNGIIHNKDVSVLYYNRAIFLTGLGMFDSAYEDLKMAFELSPSLEKYALKDEELKETYDFVEDKRIIYGLDEDKLMSFIKNSVEEILMDELDESEVHVKGIQDVVTERDVAMERKIKSWLLKEYPEDLFIGEEENHNTLTDERTWLLDPIDGTANYINRIPYYGVQLSLMINKEAVFSLVYLPSLEEMYYAYKGKGAYLNGKRLYQNTEDEIKDILLTFGDFSKSNPTSRGYQLQSIGKLANEALRVRIQGASSVDFAFVASGKNGAHIMFSRNIWELESGLLLAKESGCRIGKIDGRKHGFEGEGVIVARNEKILEQIIKSIT